MLGVFTNHPHHAFALDDLALAAHFFYRGSDFHKKFINKILGGLRSPRVLESLRYPAFCKVVGCYLEHHPVAGKYPNMIHPQASRKVAKHHLAGIKLDAKLSVRKAFYNLSFKLYRIVFLLE